jgi:hypothetical protein
MFVYNDREQPGASRAKVFDFAQFRISCDDCRDDNDGKGEIRQHFLRRETQQPVEQLCRLRCLDLMSKYLLNDKYAFPNKG